MRPALSERILAVDVGAGTQDILLYESGRPVENCLQMVLPSRTTMVAGIIARATAERKDIFLTGNLMGGGPCVAAVRRHLSAGLRVYATPRAAATIHDDLARVRALGVEITGDPPPGTAAVELRDVDLPLLGEWLGRLGLDLPATTAVAVQDHGEAPGTSNRRFRFQLWERFLEEGGDLRRLVYREIPPYLTRMRAVQEDVPGAWLMDTGAAAVWGALADPRVKHHAAGGALVVNLGNAHTLAVLVEGQRVWGICEHHTRRLDPARLLDYLRRFRRGTLTGREIYEDGGHGCAIHPAFRAGRGFRFVAVTGPQRHLAAGTGFYPAAPFGNMMLTGCFGLVAAVREATAGGSDPA